MVLIRGYKNMTIEDAVIYIENIFKQDTLKDSIFEPYYVDIHKIIWKEKYDIIYKARETPSVERVDLLNASIHDLLTLTCENYAVPDAAALNKLYKEQSESRNDFLKYVHRTIMFRKMEETIEQDTNAKKYYVGSLVSQTHLQNKLLEQKPFHMSLGNKLWSEKQIYAIASIYAIELALLSFKEKHIVSLSRIQSDLYQFLSGPEYSEILGIKGANKKHTKNRLYKKRALEIYIQKELSTDSNYSAANEILKALKIEGVTAVSIETIETKWLPEFKRKRKLLK